MGVKTSPQTIIKGTRIGGYDALRLFFGQKARDPKAVTYRPVIALFAMTAAKEKAASQAVYGTLLTIPRGGWFIAFSMCVLALLDLRGVESFSGLFLNYDLLAQRWVPYSCINPFVGGLAGILMAAGVLLWLSVSISLFIGGFGAVSVFQAIYVSKRELRCACVGDDSNGPLGFTWLTENLLMITMAVWMLIGSSSPDQAGM